MTEFNLQHELQSLSDIDLYQITSELDVPSLSPTRIDEALDGAVEMVTMNTESIVAPEVFDIYRSLLKYVHPSRSRLGSRSKWQYPLTSPSFSQNALKDTQIHSNHKHSPNW
jgi:hypothetical protein